jgi:predicted nucleic acid-binding protein
LAVVLSTRPPDPDLARLHGGEPEAILLAEELGTGQIIIDEIRGGTLE